MAAGSGGDGRRGGHLGPPPSPPPSHSSCPSPPPWAAIFEVTITCWSPLRSSPTTPLMPPWGHLQGGPWPPSPPFVVSPSIKTLVEKPMKISEGVWATKDHGGTSWGWWDLEMHSTLGLLLLYCSSPPNVAPSGALVCPTMSMASRAGGWWPSPMACVHRGGVWWPRSMVVQVCVFESLLVVSGGP